MLEKAFQACQFFHTSWLPAVICSVHMNHSTSEPHSHGGQCSGGWHSPSDLFYTRLIPLSPVHFNVIFVGVSQRVWSSTWNNIIWGSGQTRFHCAAFSRSHSSPSVLLPGMCCPHKATRTGTAASCHSAAGPFFIYPQIGFSAVSQMAHKSHQNGFRSDRTLCWNSLLPPSLAPLHHLPPVAQSLLQLTAKGNRKFSPGCWEGPSPSRGSLSASHQFWPIIALSGATPATLPHFPVPPQWGHGNTTVTYVNFSWPQGYQGNTRVPHLHKAAPAMTHLCLVTVMRLLVARGHLCPPSLPCPQRPGPCRACKWGNSKM